jgi:hypothetical protein
MLKASSDPRKVRIRMRLVSYLDQGATALGVVVERDVRRP